MVALSFVNHVDSLYSIPRLQLLDGIVVTDAYLKYIPDDRPAVEAIFDAASASPFTSRNLLSDDHATMAVIVNLKDQRVSGVTDADIVSSLDASMAVLGGQVQRYFQLGPPFVRQTITERMLGDQSQLLPVSVIVLMLVLIVLVRSVSFALVPIITAFTSILWLLGFMAFMNLHVTVVTSIVPVLLIIIGSTADVHLMSEFIHARVQGKDIKNSIRQMAERKGFAILLSFVTTYLGFLSIGLNRIQVLQEFGIVASTGLLFNFVITVLVVPVLLRYFGRWIRLDENVGAPEFLPWLNLVCFLIHHRRVPTLALFGITAVIGLVGAASLTINNNVLDYFRDDSPIKQRASAIKGALAGTESFMIVVDSGIEGTFLHTRYLEEIQRVQRFIRDTGNFDASISFVDYLSMLNSLLNELDHLEMPEDDEVIAELQTFLSRDDISHYVNQDYSGVVILVRHSLDSTRELNHALEQLRLFMRANVTPRLQVHITGEAILVNDAVDSVATGQALSLALMTVIIFVIIGLLFVNARVGLIAIAPNIFPIIVLFGVMGFAGIPLDTGTAMVAAIAIGISIDDTVHFLVRYNAELQQSHDEELAMTNTVHGESLPIISTSLALVVGFAVLALSSFLPVAYFGLLSAMVMLLAVVADFIILPILLSATRLVTLWDLFSLQLRAQLLNECRLFKGMRPWQVKKLILSGDVREYAADEIIMEQGEAGVEMYILLDGSAELSTRRDDGSVDVYSTAQTGRVFGAIAVQDGSRRVASARALEPTRVLSLSWASLERIARFHPRLSSRFFRNLSALLAEGLANRLKA